MNIGLVIPNFNYARFIGETFESILDLQIPAGVDLAQITVVDDGSTDSSLKVISRYRDHFERAGLKYEVLIHPENMGVSTALNTGIEKTLTDWIFPFGSDNILLPHALEEVFSIAYKDGKRVADVVALGWRGFGKNHDGSPYKRTKLYKLHPNPRKVKQGRHLAAGCSPYIRETWVDYPYRTDLLKGEDGDRWKRLVERGYRFRPTLRHCALVRGHNLRLSASSDPGKLTDLRKRKRI